MRDVFPLYRDKTLDNFETLGNPSLENAVNQCRGYIERVKLAKDKGLGLTFVGENGVGKTHLACAVLKEVVANREVSRDGGECIALATWMGMYQELFRTQDRLKVADPDESETTKARKLERRLGWIRETSFLLLDDLGREHASVSGWSSEMVFDLLRYRHVCCLPTLITTNIPNENPNAPMDLRRRYSEGLSSWIREATIIITMEGEDYRPHVNAER